MKHVIAYWIEAGKTGLEPGTEIKRIDLTSISGVRPDWPEHAIWDAAKRWMRRLHNRPVTGWTIEEVAR